ncbi:MAG: RNA repair domain-containing protein [Candidatus Woesearchaeota archaeon]
MAFLMRESDKHFLWSLFGAVGVILFWKGIWEGVGSLPLVENGWVSLFVGLAILTFSGMIFREFDPLGGLEKGALKILHSVHNHPQKHEFTIHYYDKVKKKNVEVKANYLKHIEKNNLSIHTKDKEIFIPIHRVSAISRNDVVVWKL